METESQKVIQRYEKRKASQLVARNQNNIYFDHFVESERELKYAEILKKHFSSFDSIRLLEIGAGSGGNLFFFKRLGLKWENLFANELIPERMDVLKKTFPLVTTLEGDASEIAIDEIEPFDVVFQSAVFTSLLDDMFKDRLAKKMWSLLKPGGIILWYDFTYNNPNNKDVKGIKKSEVRKLFPGAKTIRFNKVTLAPPLSRRVKKMYHFFNLLPILRTHLIAEITKGFDQKEKVI